MQYLTIDISVDFYKNIPGLKAHVVWERGAYFTAGDLWYCLSVDRPCKKEDYTHIAFTVDSENFQSFCENLINKGVSRWKENSGEGDSMYFLDPDRHKLEIHVGNLQTRLKSIREKPYSNTQWQVILCITHMSFNRVNRRYYPGEPDIML